MAESPPSTKPKKVWRFTPTVSMGIMSGVSLVLIVAGVASSGFPGLLIMAGLISLITAVFTLITGRKSWASIPSRKVAAIVLAAGMVVTIVGGSLAPKTAGGGKNLADATINVSGSSSPSSASADAVGADPSPVASPVDATPTPTLTHDPPAMGPDTGGLVVLPTGVVLPNSSRTPGATNPAVTQATIGQTICVSGWTATVRPSSSVTTALKVQQLATGYAYNGDTTTGDYEEDHLISLELGGAPAAWANLWPEPYNVAEGARVKDRLENKLHALVCAGTISLAVAQSAIASNWWTAYQTYVGGTPAPAPAPVVPVAPAPVTPGGGATALCKDGTYSYAATHRGACSHHGGVAVFYK